MPVKSRYAGEQIEEYLSRKVKHRRLSEENAKRYRYVLKRMLAALAEVGLETAPQRIGERELEHLLECYSRLDSDTQKWMFNILNGWMVYNKNHAWEDMMVSWPAETRTNVDWLSPEESLRMLEAAQGVERIVIHLELRLWFRRIEVQRLLTRDVVTLEEPVQGPDYSLEGYLGVNGKGRGGGKWRNVAWAPDTRLEVEFYNLLRSEMVARARRYDPRAPDPEEWIIYQKGRRLKGYGRTAIDSIVARVAVRAGISRKIGNHTLRRTGARLAYFAGVPLLVIMEALGHSSEKQTIRYLGLTINEGAKGQQKVYEYLQTVRARPELVRGRAVIRTGERPS